MNALLYILVPTRFVRDMRAFRVTEFSVFLLFLIGSLLAYLWYREEPPLQGEVLFAVLFCVFSYGLYAYYKVRWMPFLTLYISISIIATVWSYVLEACIYALSGYFSWEIGAAGLVVSYLFWSLIYVVLFHAICHDMQDKRNAGMVVVRKD